MTCHGLGPLFYSDTQLYTSKFGGIIIIKNEIIELKKKKKWRVRESIRVLIEWRPLLLYGKSIPWLLLAGYCLLIS